MRCLHSPPGNEVSGTSRRHLEAVTSRRNECLAPHEGHLPRASPDAQNASRRTAMRCLHPPRRAPFPRLDPRGGLANTPSTFGRRSVAGSSDAIAACVTWLPPGRLLSARPTFDRSSVPLERGVRLALPAPKLCSVNDSF